MAVVAEEVSLPQKKEAVAVALVDLEPPVDTALLHQYQSALSLVLEERAARLA